MINSDYIYRKIHKNVKKANLLKKDLPLKYDISNFKIVIAIANILQITQYAKRKRQSQIILLHTIMNKQINLSYATASYKAFKLSI